ncbi:hypothetical protein D3C87_247580 [compost metagenome]
MTFERAHKWEIFADGGSYLPSMCDHFPGTDIGFSYDNEQGYQFSAYSYHLDAVDDPHDAAVRLYSLQILLNGAMNAAAGNGRFVANKITFSRFLNLDSGQHFHIDVCDIEEVPFSSNPAIDRIARIDVKSDFTAWLLNSSKNDADLRGLVFLLGIITTNTTMEKILTWGTLYKILDTIRHLSKQCSFNIDNFAPSVEIERFTLACNKSAFLGIYARHGSSQAPLTKKVPMTDLSEAMDLLLSMSKKFCIDYMKLKHL